MSQPFPPAELKEILETRLRDYAGIEKTSRKKKMLKETVKALEEEASKLKVPLPGDLYGVSLSHG